MKRNCCDQCITTICEMATEEVVDDSKNESGIPRAVFVVGNLSNILNLLESTSIHSILISTKVLHLEFLCYALSGLTKHRAGSKHSFTYRVDTGCGCTRAPGYMLMKMMTIVLLTSRAAIGLSAAKVWRRPCGRCPVPPLPSPFFSLPSPSSYFSLPFPSTPFPSRPLPSF